MNGNVYNIGDSRRHSSADRPLSDTLNETVRELKAFVETRFAMLGSEMREKVANIKSAAPLAVVGAMLAGTAWLLLTAGLVAVLAVAFQGSAYALFLSFVIVGVVYAIIGGATLWIAFGHLSGHTLIPERTINVLKEDKVWLENEARTHL